MVEHAPRARRLSPTVSVVRVLDFAQRWVAAVPWTNLNDTTAILTRCHAFLEPGEAEDLCVGLRIPDRFETSGA